MHDVNRPSPPSLSVFRHQQGMALLTVLLALLMLIVMVMVTLSMSINNLSGTRESEKAIRARWSAESGRQQAFFVMSSQGYYRIQNVLQGVVDIYALNSLNDPAQTPVIASSAKPALLQKLTKEFIDYRVMNSGMENTGESRVDIRFTDLRPDTASFGAGGQTYYLDFEIESVGYNSWQQAANDDDGQNRAITSGDDGVAKMLSEGTMRVKFTRRYITSYQRLVDNTSNQLAQETNPTINATRYSVYPWEVYDEHKNNPDYLFNFDGPVHVNGQLAISGKPRFAEGLTTSDWNTGYADGGGNHCQNITGAYAGRQVFAQSWYAGSYSGCSRPNTEGYGIQHRVPRVDLPANGGEQIYSVLGLTGAWSTEVNNAAFAPQQNAVVAQRMCEVASLSPCPANGVLPAGPYMPVSGGKPTAGIYFNLMTAADVVLKAEGKRQTITVTEKTTPAVVYTVVIDGQAGTTTVTSPAGTTTTQGVPSGQMYFSQPISLSGPPRTGTVPEPSPKFAPDTVPPAVASDMGLNVTAPAVNITGDLTLSDNPAEKSDAKNILGVMAFAGSVKYDSDALKAKGMNNLYVMASLFAGGNRGRGDPANGIIGLSRPALELAGAGMSNPIFEALHLYGSAASTFDGPLRFDTNYDGQADWGFQNGTNNYDKRLTNGAMIPPGFPRSRKLTVELAMPMPRSYGDQ